MAEADERRAQQPRLAPRQGQRRMGARPIQGVRLEGPDRELRGLVRDARLGDPRAAGATALQGHSARGADPRRLDLDLGRARPSRLSAVPGRRRGHRPHHLRQLRHARRLQGAPAHGRRGQGQDRGHALRRRLARAEAEAGPGPRRGRRHPLFRPARRRLWRRPRLSGRPRPSAHGHPARLGGGHHHLSRRSPDAWRRRPRRS